MRPSPAARDRAAAIVRRIAGLGPARVAGTVLAVHLAWLAVFFATGHEIRDLIRIGPVFLTQSHRSTVITVDPTYRYPANNDATRKGEGYDGQFYYYLALDPRNARYYMDHAGYRYLRPLYPLAARVLAVGRKALVPWALLVLNLLAVGAGTFALARWLARRGSVPAFALLYGLSAGLLVAVERDLTEPLAYALVAGAALLLTSPRRGAWLGAAALVALSTFARQTTAIFAPMLAAGLLFAGPAAEPWRARVRANLPRALLFGVIAVVPYLVYSRIVGSWLGQTNAGSQFTAVPYRGFFAYGPFQASRQGVSLLTVALPVTAWIVVAALLLRARTAEWAAALTLLANGLALVVLNVDSNAYTARGRGALGVAVALVFLAPAFAGLAQRARCLLVASCATWLVMLPVVFGYGLG